LIRNADAGFEGYAAVAADRCNLKEADHRNATLCDLRLGECARLADGKKRQQLRHLAVIRPVGN
jgi:hypothetical protein